MSIKNFRLQVLVPRGLQARIAKAAQRAKISQGEWVRRAIDRALREPAAAGDPLEALSILRAPTADIDQMLAEIGSGRS
jgi:hypothetical protein